eukprot:551644-Amphidinium_carterae.1
MVGGRRCAMLLQALSVSASLSAGQGLMVIVFKIDDHLCIGIAGLTGDGRVLAEYMRNECLNHKYVYDAPMNIGRLVNPEEQ